MPLRHIHMSFLKMIFSFLITKHMFVAESVGMHKRRKELTLETYSLEMYHYLFYFYPLPSHPRFAWCLQSRFSKVTVHFTVLLAFRKLVQLIPQKQKKNLSGTNNMASARGNKYLIILFMLFEGLHRHLGSFYDLDGLSEKL